MCTAYRIHVTQRNTRPILPALTRWMYLYIFHNTAYLQCVSLHIQYRMYTAYDFHLTHRMYTAFEFYTYNVVCILHMIFTLRIICTQCMSLHITHHMYTAYEFSHYASYVHGIWFSTLQIVYTRYTILHLQRWAPKRNSRLLAFLFTLIFKNLIKFY